MTRREVTFDGGVRTAAGFLLAFVALTLVLTPIKSAVVEMSAGVRLLTEVAQFLVLAGIGAAFLRADGVTLDEIGISRRFLAPAVAGFAAVWVVLNALGVVAALATGNEWGVSFLWVTVSSVWEPLGAPWVTTILLQFLVIGVVEEFVFRGYFQTKMIALLGDDSRLQRALGVLTASVLFGLAHVPGAAIDGASLSGMVGTAAFLALSGVGFGVMYELTGNVWFVALLHGLGNTWPLVVDGWSWPGNELFVFLGFVSVVYFVGVAGYRRVASGTAWTPKIRRSDADAS
jgi:membrane protease YdiL (CAAX protease family)